MKAIDANELKSIELELLTDFHNLCTERGFRYALAGGTLLGAIRHGGFIPWDDDIDLVMPRPDYDAFIAYCQQNKTPFKLLSHETEEKYGYLFAKICNPNTVLIEENTNSSQSDMGVYVDIFPVDGFGNTMEEARKSVRSVKFLLYVLVAANWKRFFFSKTRKRYLEPVRFVFFLISRFCSRKQIIAALEKKTQKYSLEECQIAGCYSSTYLDREILDKNIYLEYIDIGFEGRQFKGLKNYDTYLSTLYGDYMKLPPVEKQVSHHMFTAYWK